MNENLMNEFIREFNALKNKIKNGEVDEREIIKLAGKFNKETGGKLSHYNSPLAVGVAVVKVDNNGEIGYLGFKRGIMPFIGGVAFPGGFVNENEGSKEASIRELMEETGLQLDDSPNWTYVDEKKTPNNQLLIFYMYDKVLDWKDIQKQYELLEDKSESQGLVFLNKDTEMCFSLHSEIRDFLFTKD